MADLRLEVDPLNPYSTLVTWKHKPVGFLKEIAFRQTDCKMDQMRLVFNSGYRRFPSKDFIDRTIKEMQASGVEVVIE